MDSSPSSWSLDIRVLQGSIFRCWILSLCDFSLGDTSERMASDNHVCALAVLWSLLLTEGLYSPSSSSSDLGWAHFTMSPLDSATRISDRYLRLSKLKVVHHSHWPLAWYSSFLHSLSYCRALSSTWLNKSAIWAPSLTFSIPAYFPPTSPWSHINFILNISQIHPFSLYLLPLFTISLRKIISFKLLPPGWECHSCIRSISFFKHIQQLFVICKVLFKGAVSASSQVF